MRILISFSRILISACLILAISCSKTSTEPNDVIKSSVSKTEHPESGIVNFKSAIHMLFQNSNRLIPKSNADELAHC
jgi:hypothetical protein